MADMPAAHDSMLVVTYAVEKSGDTRTTTALAAGAYRTLPATEVVAAPAAAPVGT